MFKFGTIGAYKQVRNNPRCKASVDLVPGLVVIPNDSSGNAFPPGASSTAKGGVYEDGATGPQGPAGADGQDGATGPQGIGVGDSVTGITVALDPGQAMAIAGIAGDAADRRKR